MADIKKVFQDMHVSLVGQVYKAINKEDMGDIKKKTAVNSIFEDVEKIGFKDLIRNLKVADAQAICEAIKIDFKGSKYSKNVLSKRLAERMVKDGLEELLSEIDEEYQAACLTALGLEKTSSKSQHVRIANEVRRRGAEVVLSKMDTPFLKEVGEDMKLDVEDVTSQAQLVEAILTGKVPPKRHVEIVVEKISKHKPKFQAGISVADMMQYYNLEDLQDFARDNSLIISGKKKELAKRIFAFFEEEQEKPAKKAKVEKKVTKKEDKKEEKEEEEEEDEEEEEEKVVEKEEKKEKKDKKKSKKEEKEEEKEEEEVEREDMKKEKTPKKETTPSKGKKDKKTKETGER